MWAWRTHFFVSSMELETCCFEFTKHVMSYATGEIHESMHIGIQILHVINVSRSTVAHHIYPRSFALKAT
jgi:hypothetical protein